MSDARIQGPVAVLADLHGNIVALDTVLAEVAVLGIDRILIAGDLAWGPHPAEVVRRVMGMEGATVIRGNADREVADPASVADDPLLGESTAWCAAQLTGAERDWLRQLALTADLRAPDGGRLLLCHGSPGSDVEGLAPEATPEDIRRWMGDTSAGTIVCGHTHRPFTRVVGAHRILNPGSVGLHAGSPDARWATIDTEGGVTLRSTPYDRDRAATLATASGSPDAEAFAAWLREPMG